MTERREGALVVAMRAASAETADCPDLFDRVARGVRRTRQRQWAAAITLAIAVFAVASPAFVRGAATTPAIATICSKHVSEAEDAAVGNAPVVDGSARHYWDARVVPAVVCFSTQPVRGMSS
jgi:hypothetical protein